jgi:hypothetical protein
MFTFEFYFLGTVFGAIIIFLVIRLELRTRAKWEEKQKAKNLPTEPSEEITNDTHNTYLQDFDKKNHVFIENSNFSRVYSCAGFQYNNGPQLRSLLRVNDRLTLVPEPLNKYNKNAVAIQWEEKKIGYIPDEYCKDIATMLSLGFELRAKIYEFHWGAYSYHKVKINVWTV